MYGRIVDAMRILITPGVGEIEEKKSKFICHLKPVSGEEEAQRFFEETKKKYWDAKHNCTAYVIGRDAELTRCNDDGEPSQTAGRPMLNVLLHSEVRNVACVVTRYFGGVLLGTGGLIKAYSDAVADALAKSVIGEEIEGVRIPFTVDYVSYGKIKYEMEKQSVPMEDGVFSENITTAVKIPVNEKDRVIRLLTDLTKGKAEIGEITECSILKTILKGQGE